MQRIVMPSVLSAMLILPGNATAQTDSAKKEEPAAKEEPSLISPSAEFTSIQKPGDTVELKAILKAKIKGTFLKLPLLKVTFLQVIDTATVTLGYAITDRNGAAVFNYKTAAVSADKEGKIHFKAVFAGNKSMEAAEEELAVKRARLDITAAKEDSVLNVKIKLLDLGKDTPIKGTVVGIFVHRSFSLLKIGEGTTDDDGEATVEVPANLPGDANGNITLVAKLDENETFGNLEASVIQKWGTPVSDKIENQPRALWSSHPPLWMLITFFILMGIVWSHYVVIVVQLFRLRKEEPHTATIANT
ncbi:hypothetical protein [Ferruginibacter sp. SUN106]|uniref:hypothetical protein n=1 Tax=Ferruginibacter sp. SUN106 TaxID=2978348 RepID=UPI003D361BBB